MVHDWLPCPLHNRDYAQFSVLSLFSNTKKVLKNKITWKHPTCIISSHTYLISDLPWTQQNTDKTVSPLFCQFWINTIFWFPETNSPSCCPFSPALIIRCSDWVWVPKPFKTFSQKMRFQCYIPVFHISWVFLIVKSWKYNSSILF